MLEENSFLSLGKMKNHYLLFTNEGLGSVRDSGLETLNFI